MSFSPSVDNKQVIQGVYYIEEKGMNPIAIRPEIHQSCYFSFQDTGHGRIIQFTKIFFDTKSSTDSNLFPKEIKVIKTDSTTLHFVQLTKQIFDEKLKNVVAGGKSLHFKNDKELQNYFLTTNFGQ